MTIKVRKLVIKSNTFTITYNITLSKFKITKTKHIFEEG